MDAYKKTSQVITVPGCSEHEIGLALDITSDTYTQLLQGFGETEEGKWLAEHGHEYGFIVRYPSGKEYITGIVYEPWHFRYVGRKVPDTEVRLSKEALNFAMACEITRKNRIILLSLCGARYDTRLYSYQNSEVIKNVKKCPQVDYLKEMPLVFACSKINLNPSLRIIQTGIPLRAFDIMGAGGFLLSNYQEELLEYFENEKDMVVYDKAV